jgi:DNA-binding MarR family transcriptional regulator
MAQGATSHTQNDAIGKTRPLGPLSDLVSVQLRRVDILLTRGFAVASMETNLRSGAISCLGLIVGNPGISQNELAQQTGTDKSNIVSLANTLEQLGWAERVRDQNDRRRHGLFATPEGEAALNQLALQIKAVEDALLAQISPQELEALCHLLERMHASCVDVIYHTGNVAEPR